MSVRVENSGKMICAERSKTPDVRLLAAGDSRITSPFMDLCRHLCIVGGTLENVKW